VPVAPLGDAAAADRTLLDLAAAFRRRRTPRFELTGELWPELLCGQLARGHRCGPRWPRRTAPDRHIEIEASSVSPCRQLKELDE